jgi:transporter family-2 protein
MTQGYQLGLLAAFGTGVIFAFVTALEGILGRDLGALNATVLEHVFSGMVAILLLIWILRTGNIEQAQAKPRLPLAALLGLLVFIAVSGIAYAFPKIGFATGNFVLVLAQITTAVIIDAVGLGGFERIPISALRVVGLVLMGLGVYFVLPK